MKKLFAALAFTATLVLTAAPAGANEVTAQINCERWAFHYSAFPSGQDVVLAVAVQLPQGEGAVAYEEVHTGGQVSGDVHGVYEVPVHSKTIVNVWWTLDGYRHTASAESEIECGPPEEPTTTTTTAPPTSPTTVTPPTTVPPTSPTTVPTNELPPTGINDTAATGGIVLGAVLVAVGAVAVLRTRKAH